MRQCEKPSQGVDMAHKRIRALAGRLGAGLAFVAGLVLPAVAHAAGQQDPAAIQAHAEQFLKKQPAGLPGKVTIQVAAPRAALREGDLGSLPADVGTNADDLKGYRTVSGVAAGAPLRNALLRPPLAVQQGQSTRLVMNGPGFSIQSEGLALANASRGDRVRVKTPSGEVVSGVAQDGQRVGVAF